MALPLPVKHRVLTLTENKSCVQSKVSAPTLAEQSLDLTFR